MESSVVKKTLKSICCSNGWSYALLWRFNQQNPMLLTLENAYNEEQMSSFVDNMLPQFHILGQGIIGQAASTGDHSWICSDFVLENSEMSRQFSCGIKTIAVVPVEPKGVLQFGSTRKISESTEFLNRTKRLFCEMENAADGYPRSSFTNEADDLSELFTSLNDEMLFNDLNGEAFLQSVVSTSTWRNEFEQGIRGESLILPSLPEEYTPADFPTNNLCQPMGDILMDFPIDHSHTSGQKDLFEALELDFRCGKSLDSWKDFSTPLPSTNPSTSMSGCVSELPRKGLFSELGLEKFLQGGTSSSCVTNSSFEDQVPFFTKRRKTQTSSFATALSSLSGSMQPLLCNFEKPQQVGRLWIDDIYGSINAGKPKKPEEAVVKDRKRARPNQSTRPRPKDRQMIQDRLKELKVLIPNGAKMSIDSLLDQTVKYMLFLQSVTKYAEKLKEVDQPKENVLALKDNIPSGGATWAFEVGGQTMGCPIVIKDLSQPGQKLIEMVCEDRGLFLEIAEVIRGLGFNIWKGEIEVQGDKLWAHFIIEESNKENIHTTRPTRVEILESLLKHTQSTGTRGIESSHQITNDVRNDGIPRLNYHQQPQFPFPVSVGQTH